MTIQKGLLGRQDFNLWTGNAEFSFNRRTATGGVVTLYKHGHEVDVQAMWAGEGAANESAIAKALLAIGSRSASIILFPGNWAIDADLTIPANVMVHAPAGCAITVASGKTLTVSGAVIAGPYRIFYGSGTATVTGYPQDQAWWGETQRNDFSSSYHAAAEIDAAEIAELEADEATLTLATIATATITAANINGGEIKNTLVDYYDANDELIHQISSNNLLDLGETFTMI